MKSKLRTDSSNRRTVGRFHNVSTFLKPSAGGLTQHPATMLSHFAAVFGKVMPFWYAGALVLIALDTKLNRHTPEAEVLLAATVI